MVQKGSRGVRCGIRPDCQPHPSPTFTSNSIKSLTHVVAENVEPTVVRSSLLCESIITVPANWAIHEVMLGDKVSCTGVQAACKEGRHDEVDEGSPAEKVDKEVVEREDRGDVYTVPDGRFLSSDESWSESVKEQLESAEV